MKFPVLRQEPRQENLRPSHDASEKLFEEEDEEAEAEEDRLEEVPLDEDAAGGPNALDSEIPQGEKFSPEGREKTALHRLWVRGGPPLRIAGEEDDVAALASSRGCSVPYIVTTSDTLSGIASRFGIPRDRLEAANPELANLDILATGQILTIPLSEPRLVPAPRQAVGYVVQPGNTLRTLAEQFGMSEAAILATNPNVHPDRVFPGQILFLPVVPDADPPTQAILFIVGSGDTLANIAQRFQTTVTRMIAANPQLPSPDHLQVGEIVVVPGPEMPSQPVMNLQRYIVQQGDTPLTIARRFGVRVEDLERLNLSLSPLHPGTVLVIPEPIPMPAPPQSVPGFPCCRPAPFGERLNLGDDDFLFVPFPDNFRFPFYGTLFSDGIFVNSNGSLTLGEGDGTFIPFTDLMLEGPPRIAPSWTDLFPPGAPADGGLFVDFPYDEDLGGTRMVVTWDRVPHFLEEAPQTFQAQLHPDGSIQFCYFQVTPLGEPVRWMIGVARGENIFRGNAFRFNAGTNPRRIGPPEEPTPKGGLTGRILVFEFDPDLGDYRLRFTPPN